MWNAQSHLIWHLQLADGEAIVELAVVSSAVHTLILFLLHESTAASSRVHSHRYRLFQQSIPERISSLRVHTLIPLNGVSAPDVDCASRGRLFAVWTAGSPG
jgi:hypothetical protein